jgi:hypothetical protein
LLIKDAGPEDWDAIWPFFHQIVAAGETYAYDRDMDEAEGRRMWMIGPPGRTVVATHSDGTVLGTGCSSCTDFFNARACPAVA